MLRFSANSYAPVSLAEGFIASLAEGGRTRMFALVVDDERSVRDALSRALRSEGYDVHLAASGGDALGYLTEHEPDVIVLDVGLPGLDGLETCRLIRAKGDEVPILMLTARSGVSDRVAGLDAGADDYLVKPFALEELLARLRALLRRNASPPTPIESSTLSYGGLNLDPGTRDVTVNGESVTTTRLEFALLELFLRHPRQVLTREVIFDRVWGYDFGSNSNSLEVYIGYLRRKTERDDQPRLIHTVRGVGYVLRDTPP
jgi:two-component system response regulator MprA